MLTAHSQPSTDTITVSPVAGHIGAEIGGVDIGRPLDAPALRTIRDALHRHKVLFFRDQPLDHDSHLAFARQFGEPTYASLKEDVPPAGYPEIFPLPVSGKEYRTRSGGYYVPNAAPIQYNYFAGWHSDLTAVINPPAAAILRADAVPDFGGDTMWSSLVTAYQGLSTRMRAFLDGLRAEHRYVGTASSVPGATTPYVSIHPLVRVHPETGERLLFVNPTATTRIVDVTPAESHALLALLNAEITRPEYTVRLHWRPGTVAFWDNRATSHLAPGDLGHLDVERVLYRVMLTGEVPVGPDGQESVSVCGEPFDGSFRPATGDLGRPDRL